MAERKLPHHPELPEVKAEAGPRLEPFNLASAIYHVSGASILTFECPHGIRDPKECQVDFDQILDIQLTLYEAMLRHALEAKKSGPLK